MDVYAQATVVSRRKKQPPTDAAEGDCYLCYPGATDEWLGHNNEFAQKTDDAWVFFKPVDGMRVWVVDEAGLFVYHKSAWRQLLKFGSHCMLNSLDVLSLPEKATAGAVVLSTGGDFPKPVYFDGDIWREMGGVHAPVQFIKD